MTMYQAYFSSVVDVGEGQRTRELAEREGFEPPIRLPVCRISSAVLSTTQPPLQAADLSYLFGLGPTAESAVTTEIVTRALVLAFAEGFSNLECQSS